MQEDAISGAGPKTRGCCAILVLVVALQLGLMIALLRVESNAADAAAGSFGVSGGGPERVYCTITEKDFRAVSIFDRAVNAAVADGCTLVGGVSVSGDGGNDASGYFAQAMMCQHGSGCAK